MNGTELKANLASALAAAHAAVDELQAGSLDRSTDDELLDVWRELERLNRRLPAVEHRLVLEVETRGLPGLAGCRSTAQFVRGLLRVDAGEAHGRVEGAYATGRRRNLDGSVLPPAYPVVAAVQARGAASPKHAHVITSLIESLPDAVRWAKADEAERDLVHYAERFDPRSLGRLAARMRDYLDPDGILDESRRRQRDRGISLRRRVDGSGQVQGECTAELAERLDVLFDSLAAPMPDPDGTPDQRSAGQRRHDALLDGLGRLQASDTLPRTRGVAATVVVTMTAEQYVTATGLARTGHGALVPVTDALAWAGADHRVLAVVVDSIKGIAGYSSLQRIFTEPQRLALYARDAGCTFPGCDAPPEWTEVHHLTDHAAGGPTDLDNAALVCRHHHRRSVPDGWRAELISGRVGWRPPPWIDPRQRARFNELHHLAPVGRP